MVELTKESSIQELVEELQGGATGPVRRALSTTYLEGSPGRREPNVANQRVFAESNIRSLGDLLTPEGELALFHLEGTGRKSMRAMYTFLADRGLTPNWPGAEAYQKHVQKEATRIRTGRGHGLNLDRAIEEADKQYAARTGEPVGDFSRKIKENTKAQEDGARLKGRRTR